MQYQAKVDLLLKITTPIVCKEGKKTIGSATGFLFGFSNKLFIITNRHVFIDESKNYFPDKIEVRLNIDPSDFTKSKVITYQLYQPGTDDSLWIEHAINGTNPSLKIDLAALEIPLPDGCIFSALAEQNLPPSGVMLGLGEQVIVIGYPQGFYDDKHNLPITRNATIASTYGIPFKGENLFLIDSRLHPGTSGSPVITIPKNVMNQPDGGMIIGTTPIWYFLGVNSGEFGGLQLNAVWYSGLIVEMLRDKYPVVQPVAPAIASNV